MGGSDPLDREQREGHQPEPAGAVCSGRDITSAGLRLQLLAEAQLGNEALRQNLTTLYQNFQGLIRGKIAERTALPADFLTWLLLFGLRWHHRAGIHRQRGL